MCHHITTVQTHRCTHPVIPAESFNQLCTPPCSTIISVTTSGPPLSYPCQPCIDGGDWIPYKSGYCGWKLKDEAKEKERLEAEEEAKNLMKEERRRKRKLWKGL
jgi:hypothetical protein